MKFSRLKKAKTFKIAHIENSIPQWALDELQNLVLLWFNKGSSFDDAMLYAVTDALSNPNLEAGIGQFNLENYESVGLSDLVKQNLNIIQDNPASETPVNDYTNPHASVNKQIRKASSFNIEVGSTILFDGSTVKVHYILDTNTNKQLDQRLINTDNPSRSIDYTIEYLDGPYIKQWSTYDESYFSQFIQ